LPQRKQDIVAAPKELAAAKGEPGVLVRYRKPPSTIAVLISVFAIEPTSLLVSMRFLWMTRKLPIFSRDRIVGEDWSLTDARSYAAELDVNI
jgi:hypothetical protein